MMREISEDEWALMQARSSSLPDFVTLVNEKIKNDYYDFRTIEKTTKATFHWLFQASSRGYGVQHCDLIKEKLDWLCSKKLIDQNLFFKEMLTNEFYYTPEKMAILVDWFNKNKLPLAEKCKFIREAKSSVFINEFLELVCPDLQADTKLALFLNKAMAYSLLKQEKMNSSETLYWHIDNLKKYNFDFTQSLNGSSLLENIMRNSEHSYIVQKIYPLLPENYQQAIAYSLSKVLDEIDSEKIQWNFFMSKPDKNTFVKEFRAMLEIALISPQKRLNQRKINKL